MVIRQWIYSTAIANAERFEAFERAAGLPMLLSQAGCLQVELLRRHLTEAADVAEYVLLSRWQSWEQLQVALASQVWKDEVALFLAQGFGEGNGTTTHYENLLG